MGIFGKRPGPDRDKTAGNPGGDALEERIALLERKLEKIDYEWSDWYDKFRRLHARIARRQQRDDETETPESQSTGGAGFPTTTSNPMALRLLQRR